MERKEYNGWTNYETWVVNLWLNDSANSQGYWQEMTGNCFGSTKASEHLTHEEETCYKLAGLIKDDLELNSPIEEASFYSDLLSSAISAVNFDEIAKHFIEQYQETAK